MSAEQQFDVVERPSHYNTSKFIHSVCGHPIEVIDITRRLNFCKGNTGKYVLRAGEKVEEGGDPLVAEIEDLKKARKYLDFEIADLEAQLAARETKEILADPGTMEAIAEGTAELSRREDHGDFTQFLVSIRYEPAGDDDPWSAKQVTEAVSIYMSVGDLKAMAVGYFSFGDPGLFELRADGTYLAEFGTVGSLIKPGADVTLMRRAVDTNRPAYSYRGFPPPSSDVNAAISHANGTH